MSNVNLELPQDGTVPESFVLALNDRMRQIQLALGASSPAASTKVNRSSVATPVTTTTTVSSGTLQGSHAARMLTSAATLSTGTQFWETDRFSVYVVEQVGGAGTWAFEAGFYSDFFSQRPADLGAYDDGFVFFATDRNALYTWSGAAWQLLTGAMRGLFASRPTGLSNFDVNFRFFATDRTVTYRWTGTAWVYESGTMRGTLAATPTLTANDAGFLFYCTTGTGFVSYNHSFKWSGTVWTVADNEKLGGYFQDYAKAPTEGGWHACDGSATLYLDIVTGVLTEVAFTTPDLTGVYRVGAAAYSGSVVAAAGSVALSGTTDPASAGTPSGTNAVGVPSATTTVQSGTGISVPVNTHNHTAVFAGNAMTAHDHTLSDAVATFTGNPVDHVGVFAYFRR